MNDPIEPSQPPAGPPSGSADDARDQDPFAEPFDQTPGFDEPIGHEPKTRMSKSTLAMVGLFAVGVLVVGGLSLRGGPREASAVDQAAEKKVDNFIQKSRKAVALTKSLQDSREVVGAFYDFASRRQVPVEDLQANPFVFGDDKTASRKPTTSPAPRVAGVRKAELEVAVGQLKLQSIMMGPRGSTAIIDNQFIAEGHAVGEFTVRAITAEQVHLECDGMSFVLHLRR